jgi:hypothetical protein
MGLVAGAGRKQKGGNKWEGGKRRMDVFSFTDAPTDALRVDGKGLVAPEVLWRERGLEEEDQSGSSRAMRVYRHRAHLLEVRMLDFSSVRAPLSYWAEELRNSCYCLVVPILSLIRHFVILVLTTTGIR